MDEHEVVAREGSDLGILEDLLDDVQQEAASERDMDTAVTEEETDTDETNELSPDEMLRQLDAVTLAGDDDEDTEDSDDHIAAFEDAHEELHPDFLADIHAENAHKVAGFDAKAAGGKVELAEELTAEGDSGAGSLDFTNSVDSSAISEPLPEKSGLRIDSADVVLNAAELAIEKEAEQAERPPQDRMEVNESSDNDNEGHVLEIETTSIAADIGDENERNVVDDVVTDTPKRNSDDGDRSEYDEDAEQFRHAAGQAIDSDEGKANRVEELISVEDVSRGNGNESAHFDKPSEEVETFSDIQDLALRNEASAADSTVTNLSENDGEDKSNGVDPTDHNDEEGTRPVLHERQDESPLEGEVTGPNSSFNLPGASVGADAAADSNPEVFRAGITGDAESEDGTPKEVLTHAEVGSTESDANEMQDINLSSDEKSNAFGASDQAQEETQEIASDLEDRGLVHKGSDLEPLEIRGNDTGDTIPAGFTDCASDQNGAVDEDSENIRAGSSSGAPSPTREPQSLKNQPNGDFSDEGVKQEACPPPESEEDLQVLPPPAPSSLAVVIGSMNPASTEDDEDSDSQDEDDGEQSSLPPPLNLDNLADDDDDELETDPAVASTIEIEKQAKSSKGSETAIVQEKEPTLLAALLGIKPTASTDDIEFSFADEIRVAHAVVSPTDSEMSSNPSKKQELLEDSTGNAFGIGYTSLKKKRDGAESAETDGYSIPTVPSFPDEKEFENELGLSSDLVFSVKSMKDDNVQADDDDDDEFGPLTASSPDEFSSNILEARRASLQAQKAQEEESIINELKKATDEEKSLNERAKSAPDSASSAVASDAPTSEFESALSLKELHGIYKRGLGDQGVAMMGEDDECEEKPSKPQQTTAQNGANPSLSVMGQILSKPSILNQAITEEDEEEEDSNDTRRGAHVAHQDRETLIDYAAEHEDAESSTAVNEWKEIQLTNRGSEKNNGQAAPESDNKQQQSRNQRDFKPSTNFKISYNEAFQYCLQADEFLLQLDKIVAEDFGEGPRSCFSCFSPRPRLTFPGAMDERDRVFCIAATSYDARHEIFTRVLQTLYVKLTRTQCEVPLSGTHWEDIGFQGNDPSTDLRGCGVLSLLQMLYLVDNHPELALRFHSLSQHPTRHFPLACALINVTLQCVVTLRSGALYKECNKQASVFKAINSFYVALASELMSEIQTSSDEIPIIIKEVLEDGRSNPDRVLEEFSKGDAAEAAAQSATSPQKQASGGAPPNTGLSSTHIEFTEIALQSAASDDDD